MLPSALTASCRRPVVLQRFIQVICCGWLSCLGNTALSRRGARRRKLPPSFSSLRGSGCSRQRRNLALPAALRRQVLRSSCSASRCSLARPALPPAALWRGRGVSGFSLRFALIRLALQVFVLWLTRLYVKSDQEFFLLLYLYNF